MASPNKTVAISPCNVYSAKQTELTGYDVAYAKELSSLVQQQQAAAMKSTDAGNKMKLVTDTITSLNLEIPKLKAQIQPLERELGAPNNELYKLDKELVPIQNAINSLQSSLAQLQAEQKKLAAELIAAKGTKDGLERARTGANTEKARLEKEINLLQGELTKIKVPVMPKKDLDKALAGKFENQKKIEAALATETAAANSKRGFSAVPHRSAALKLATSKATVALEINNLTMQLLTHRRYEEATNKIAKVKSQIDVQTKLIADYTAKINAPDPKTTSINDNININAKKIANIENEIRNKNNLAATIAVRNNAALDKIRGINAKLKNVNSLLQQTQAQITEKVAEQVKLKATNDGNSLSNTQFAKNKSDIDKKAALNKEALVKVLNDKALCENKANACVVSKKEIDDLKVLLTQYNGELNALKKKQETCNAAYQKKCSTSQLGEHSKLIADRKSIADLLKTNYTEYDNMCKGKIGDCDILYSTFQEKKAMHDVANAKKNSLKREHEVCLDPTKNGCKEIYNAANNNKATTGINIDTLKRPEEFTQFRDDDTADVTHSRLVSNYESVQNDYTKLKQSIQDLNNANNNDNTETAKYASKKQLYDNAIYTNILLTALTTSVLYYVFVEI
jgi:chromosome segregation ATPase